MKVAVTGGTGCLGQPLIDKLINSGMEIQLLVLPNDPEKKNLERKVNTISGDLNSLESLKLLTRDCKIIFHLAT